MNRETRARVGRALSGACLALATAAIVVLFPPQGAPGAGGADPAAMAQARDASSTSRNEPARLSQADLRRIALAQQAQKTVNPVVDQAAAKRSRALMSQGQQIKSHVAKVTQQQRDAEIADVLARRKTQEQARSAGGGTPPASALTGAITAYKVFADVQDTRFAQPFPSGTFSWSAGFGATGLWYPYHTGQDFSAPEGTPLYAMTDAIVGHPINEWWPGTHVVLYFADGSSSIYAHLSKSVVKPGDVVKPGQLIGHVGNTGRSFGAHLHLEYYPPNTVPGTMLASKDPVAWLLENGVHIK